ncbi:MAG: glycosyltransferase family protein [Solidesulfovibrio sp. DCME]|uniref:glycosyltransferase family protein n=1 Tax=Solidesulfovibrio sp. DCME TaxID=3447380 RepID=UPI003D12E0E3
MGTKRLAWLANPLFAQALGPILAPSGWRVDHLPVPGHRFFTFDALVDAFGFVPDALAYGDTSVPPMLLGLESYPCLTAFACVDSHIHAWYPLYAQAFDLCLVGLADHLPGFAGPFLPEARLLWSPPFAAAADRPGPEGLDGPKDMDMVFVGKDDPALTPVRSALLLRLRDRFPGFRSLAGPYREAYRRAKLVLNIAEHGDLNYRVFEALGCGAALVTPRVGHGQDAIFTDGRDLFAYDQDDFAGLCRLVEALLADPARRARAAASGLATVDAGHRDIHRARAFAERFLALPHEGLVAARQLRAPAIRARVLRPLFLHWAEAERAAPALAARFLKAARA